MVSLRDLPSFGSLTLGLPPQASGVRGYSFSSTSRFATFSRTTIFFSR